MLFSSSDPMDSCMNAAQDNQASLDEGGNLVRNDTQVSDPTFLNQISRADQLRPTSERRILAILIPKRLHKRRGKLMLRTVCACLQICSLIY